MFGPKEMAKLGFGMLMGVALGSAVRAADGAVMRWNGAPSGKGKKKGAPKSKPLAFVGKGVTFDTGGISIKSAGGMEDMKWDMAGGGRPARSSAPWRRWPGARRRWTWSGWWGWVENMPGPAAPAPPATSSPSYSGQTVEIINTGRRRPPRAGRRALVLPGAV